MIERMTTKRTIKKPVKKESVSPVVEPEVVETTSTPKPARSGIKLRTIRTVLIGITLVVLGFGFGYQYKTIERSGLSRLFNPSGPVRLDRADMDFSQFWAVWDQLEQAYVDPEKIDHERMIQGAIEGMTAAVGDPYTVYLPPKDNQQSKEDLNGEFDGIGIQLGYKNGTIAVQTPLENHPAIKEGVRAGDLIIHIKDEAKSIDQDTTGMTLQEAVKIIRGKKGTSVTLTFYREEKGSFEKTITRDTITMPSVELVYGDLVNGEWQKKDTGSIAWMRVYRFGELTQKQWDEAVGSIRQRSDVKGIVLDVRNNPGGLLREAVDLASDFIPEGVVVKQQGRYESETLTVSHRARLYGIPLVVLINEGSASASEILAGALRDRVGAQLVGQKSFGKGTVQQALDLNDGAGLHVTIAKWLLPNGDWIHDKGLTPAVEVKLPEDATDSATLRDTQLEKAVEVMPTK